MNKNLKKVVLTIGVFAVLGGAIFFGGFNKTNKYTASINPPRTSQIISHNGNIHLDSINPPRNQ